MTSSLAWVDYDSAAREKALQIVSLFKEQDSRDELGLGTIRDSFSDLLFPGTNTLQTRLRYMLIVPWVFKQLEAKKVPSGEIQARVRRFEVQLIWPLLNSDDSSGTIGKEARENIKRLPSDIYWPSLGSWGILRFDGSISDYYGSLDQIYEIRRRAQVHGDDMAETFDVPTWHPHLPDPPENFPSELSFALTREESEFLHDVIVATADESLLGWLVREKRLADVERPWEHPDLAHFPRPIRETLQHARLFSGVMRGAAILYNLMLAEIDKRESLIEEHREKISDWAGTIDGARVSAWSFPDLWETVGNSYHTIRPGARRFVEEWARHVGENPCGVADDKEARRLVKRRERSLKKNHSRFVNERAREQWGGHSGIRQMTFRWTTARTFLDDLAHGFEN